MNRSAEHDRLMTLIAAACDETADAAMLGELGAELESDSAARRLYMRYLDLHSELQRRQSSGVRDQGSGFRVRDENSKPEARNSNVHLRRVGATEPAVSGFRFRVSSFAFAAALITLALTAWFVIASFSNPQSEIDTPPSASVALLTHTQGASFTDASMPATLGSELAPGTLELTRGSAQVMFHSGAVVDLVGPCRFEMTGPNQAALTRGTLEALVPQRAHGFTVTTPGDVRVVDLGTRFTVTVDENQTSLVRVLDGLVELQVGSMAGRRLAAGQAMAVGNGQMRRVAFRPSSHHTLAYLRFEQADRQQGTHPIVPNAAPDQPAAKLVGAASITSETFGSMVPATGELNRGALQLARSSENPASVRLDQPIGKALSREGFTIEAWVRLSQPNPASRQPVAQCKTIGDADERLAFQLMAQAGHTTGAPRPEALALVIGDGDNAHFLYSNLAIVDDQWHHISAAYDPQAGVVRFTLDEHVDRIDAPSIRPYQTAGPVIVGAHSQSAGRFDARLHGAVDELRITDGIVPLDALLSARSSQISVFHETKTEIPQGDTP